MNKTETLSAERGADSGAAPCCACCREDIKAILKWVDGVTEELRTAPAIQTDISISLWNLRAELDNSVRSRSTHNEKAQR